MANDSPRIFTGHAQRYPKSMSRASQLVGTLQQMVKRGPRSLVGTVVDTSFLVTQGYALCTTELGIVRVYGVPYGQVVNQMRLFVRQQGGGPSTNRAFLFDGFAPALSSIGSTGSILYASNPLVTGSLSLGNTTASIACASSLTTASGYYWHCFFFLPSLPSVPATIFSMSTGSISSSVLLDLLPSGQLRFWSHSDTKGYLTNNTVAPHTVHWVQIQPGLSSQELLVDGIASYSALTAGSPPTFAGGTNLYTLNTLCDPAGNYPAPLGSWISKIGFGTNYSGGVIALPLGTNLPGSDDDIPSFAVSATQETNALYLCNDTPGTLSAANTAPAGTASAISLASTTTTINALGPY